MYYTDFDRDTFHFEMIELCIYISIEIFKDRVLEEDDYRRILKT